MELLSMDHLVDCLMETSTTLEFSPDTVPYWKRTSQYSSNARKLDMQEISLIVNGQIYGAIDNKRISLDDGGLFWMREGVPHSLIWEKDMLYYTLRFRIRQGDRYFSLNQNFLTRLSMLDYEYFFRNIVFILQDQEPGCHHARQLKAFMALLFTTIDTCAGEQRDSEKFRLFSQTEKRLIYSYCAQNHYTGFSSLELAKQLGMSRDYFSRLFRITYGKSAKQWIFEQKMSFAAKLLATSDITVADLAETLGYTDYYLFSRQFTKVLGLTPGRFRKRNLAIIKEQVEL